LGACPPGLRELYFALGQPGADELIFPGIRGATISRRNWVRDVWEPALAAARQIEGFEELPHFGPHKLRAGCATMLGYALTPKHVMLDFLGHEQETTTIRHYLRAFKDARAKLREGLSVADQIAQARAIFGDEMSSRIADAS